MRDYNNNNIVLTGFMATGKTTVGKLVAAHLKRAFVDTDALIEKRQGLSIPEIFAKFGESAFRQMERDIALELSKRKNLVISTGGRLLLDPTNKIALSENGLIFCLVASPEVILARLQNDGDSNRPLLNVPNPQKQILELLREREKGYQNFVHISTDDKQPSEVVDKILQHINNTSIN